MDCDGCREAMSAALDGEADAAEQARIDAHLDGCAACRSWQRDATLVTRHARLPSARTRRPASGRRGTTWRR